MNLNSIRWRLPLSYAVIALLAALSLGSVMLLVLNNYYTSLEREYLTGNAQALQPIVEQILNSGSSQLVLQDQVAGFSFLSQIRIRILDKDGRQLADSGNPSVNQMVAISGDTAGTVIFTVPFAPEYQAGAAEFYVNTDITPGQVVPPVIGETSAVNADTLVSLSAAPLGGYAFSTEPIPGDGQRSTQVVTWPISGELGRLEISNGPAYGSDILRSVVVAWAVAGILSIALAAWAGWLVSKQVTHPVLTLTEAAHCMEGGDLSVRVELPGEKQQEFTALANAFNGMAGQVENTVATLRAFVSDAAHELNTPLTALKTNLELAIAETNPTHRENFLIQALAQNQRLDELAHSLLDLSRIEVVQTVFDPLDLRKLVAEAGERFASRSEQADRLFIMDLPDSEFIIHANPAQLLSALNNLLENALKFTPSGGKIFLTLETSADTAVLTIFDTGIGIPPEDLPHLFERFHRGRNTAEYPGNGLGLAIVKAVAKAHGGTVTAKSDLGKGTKISLALQAGNDAMLAGRRLEQSSGKENFDATIS